MFVLLVPAQLFQYIRMYIVVVVGVDWKDTCVCVHAWGSTVLPLPALCLPQHPTFPPVPHPAPPWEAALHCCHQWTVVMRVRIFSNLTLLHCDGGSEAICMRVMCVCVLTCVCVVAECTSVPSTVRAPVVPIVYL